MCITKIALSNGSKRVTCVCSLSNAELVVESERLGTMQSSNNTTTALSRDSRLVPMSLSNALGFDFVMISIDSGSYNLTMNVFSKSLF